MMTMDERIAALRAMAEGIPTGYLEDMHVFQRWDTNFCISGHAWKLIFDGSGETDDKEPSGLATAHRFLCSLKRGVTVPRVCPNGECGGVYDVSCVFKSSCAEDGASCNLDFMIRDEDRDYIPGPDCPGPAPPGMHHELCLMPDEVK